MRDKPRTYDWAVVAALAAALLSFAVWGFVLIFGFDSPPAAAPGGYETYFRQQNWWPFPIFFLAGVPGLWFTWRPLLRAWAELKESGVLRARQGAVSEPSLERLLARIGRWRWTAAGAALLLAIGVNAADWAPGFPIFFGDAPRHTQLEFACEQQNPSFKWLFEAKEARGSLLCAPGGIRPAAEDEAHIEQPAIQLVYNLLLMAQQLLLVFFAALAVFQLMLHTFLFAVFERLEIARKEGLYLLLNARSPLNEFGLEHWNFALNNFYWSVSPAMLAVFLSRAATPPEDYLPGQVILGFAVPAALILPMVATILVRQARLPDCWRAIVTQGPAAAEDYRRQQLWPLDRNWSSKLGIVLAFALAALSIGFEVSQLMRV